MRIMLDTNVLISTIFFPSQQTHQLIQELCSRHKIVLCDYVIEELRMVVERKFNGYQADLERFFVELPFDLINTPKNLKSEEIPSVRDQKDTPILTAAIVDNVDVFITGDKDFLVLEIERPEIMTMREFLEKYA